MTPPPTRHCTCCNKVLVQSYGESANQFKYRQFCDRKCYVAHKRANRSRKTVGETKTVKLPTLAAHLEMVVGILIPNDPARRKKLLEQYRRRKTDKILTCVLDEAARSWEMAR